MLRNALKVCGVLGVRESAEALAWKLVVQWFRDAECGDIEHVAEKLRVAFPSPMQRWIVAGALRSVARKVEEVGE